MNGNPGQVHETDMQIVRRWRSRLGALATQALGGLFLWISVGAHFHPESALSDALGFVFVGGFGLLATYFGLIQFWNTITLRIDHDHLIVRHGPIPYPGNRDIPLDRISGTLIVPYGGGRSTGPAFAVQVVVELRSFTVISGLMTREEAQTIAATLTDWIKRRGLHVAPPATV